MLADLDEPLNVLHDDRHRKSYRQNQEKDDRRAPFEISGNNQNVTQHGNINYCGGGGGGEGRDARDDDDSINVIVFT